ncbi:hypothetical protein WJX72_007674 [[Myrmecia] bisecta]|uniref:GTP cyclohydrolase II domain-containing protein n=1 Tax=[Myrmecia] bisecta TaxID=41462 RepID=A0AAW1R874_9CHLO
MDPQRAFSAGDSRDADTPVPGFHSIPEALDDLRHGKFVVVLDDEDRENEGDLIIAADKVTPEAMAFMVEHTSGVICIAMEAADLERLRLPQMVVSAENEEAMTTAFTVTVDLKEGTTTGISASDRSKTIQALADPNSQPEQFNRPGHIFPLLYREGGVLRRPGHTEASVDLARLAGCAPAGVLSEIVDRESGEMARTPQLLEFAKQHGLKCITIADLVRHLLKHEPLVESTGIARLPTRYGTFTAHTYRSRLNGGEHLALVCGNVADKERILARVHSESLLGDVFGSQRCDTGSQLDLAMERIATEGEGVLVYLRGHQGRGVGLAEELCEYALSDNPSPCPDADPCFPRDLRDFGVGAHILADLGITSVRLMTNSASKLEGLKGQGLRIVEQVPLVVDPERAQRSVNVMDSMDGFDGIIVNQPDFNGAVAQL